MGAARRVTPPVPVLWPGATVVCIAGGPSLIREDVDFVQGRANVIAINDAWKVAPWADVLYACDANWWQFYEGVPVFTGLKYSIDRNASGLGAHGGSGVQVLGMGEQFGLSDDPTKLQHGKNSGYQAIGLAVLMGAKRVLLLGYDMQPASDGKEHWFGSHPKRIRRGMPFSEWVQSFDTIAPALQAKGVEVINCSRQTALRMFPLMRIEEALAL
jgi:hypothetical protein